LPTSQLQSDIVARMPLKVGSKGEKLHYALSNAFWKTPLLK
jgi:hypothetical protein